jgi:hypothetical protein
VVSQKESGARDAVPIKQCIQKYLEDNKARLSSDDQTVLSHLLDHPGTNRIWDVIRTHAERRAGGPLDAAAPTDFIEFILEAKRAAERESRANDTSPVLEAEINQAKTEVLKKIVRAVKRLPTLRAMAFLESVGKWLQPYPSIDISSPRVRLDRGGSRAGTYFVRDMSGYVHDLTGKWLDSQVMEVVDIVFDLKGDISVDDVRKARLK